MFAHKYVQAKIFSLSAFFVPIFFNWNAETRTLENIENNFPSFSRNVNLESEETKYII